MTEKRKSGGQPGPRGPYRPRPPTAPLPQYRAPLAHVKAVGDLGGDWLRGLIARELTAMGLITE